MYFDILGGREPMGQRAANFTKNDRRARFFIVSEGMFAIFPRFSEFLGVFVVRSDSALVV